MEGTGAGVACWAQERRLRAGEGGGNMAVLGSLFVGNLFALKTILISFAYNLYKSHVC